MNTLSRSHSDCRPSSVKFHGWNDLDACLKASARTATTEFSCILTCREGEIVHSHGSDSQYVFARHLHPMRRLAPVSPSDVTSTVHRTHLQWPPDADRPLSLHQMLLAPDTGVDRTRSGTMGSDFQQRCCQSGLCIVHAHASVRCIHSSVPCYVMLLLVLKLKRSSPLAKPTSGNYRRRLFETVAHL